MSTTATTSPFFSGSITACNEVAGALNGAGHVIRATVLQRALLDVPHTGADPNLWPIAAAISDEEAAIRGTNSSRGTINTLIDHFFATCDQDTLSHYEYVTYTEPGEAPSYYKAQPD